MPISTPEGEGVHSNEAQTLGYLRIARLVSGLAMAAAGIVGLFAHLTGSPAWLIEADGVADHVRISIPSAAACLVLGLLLIALHRHEAVRAATWSFAIGFGLVGIALNARQGNWLVYTPDDPIPPWTAVMFLAAGLRMLVAQHFYVLAPALAGAILGSSLVSLLGYAIEIFNFHVGPGLARASPPVAFGFAVLAAMALWSDANYARLSRRTRALPIAIGVTALAGMVSLRVTQSTIEHLAEMAPPSGTPQHYFWDAALIFAGNIFGSVALGFAALLLVVSRRQIRIAHEEIARRKQASADMARTTARLNRAYAELEQVLDVLGRDLRTSVDALREQARQLQVRVDTGDLPEVHRASIEIAEGARLLSNHLTELSRFAEFDRGDVIRTEIDFGRMVRETLFMNRAMIQRRAAPIDTRGAEGTLFADRTLIQQALNLMLTEALLASEGTRDPKVAIELRRTAHESTILVRASIQMNATGDEQEGDDNCESRNLALVRRIARSHGGTFLVSPGDGASRNFLLIVPDPDDPVPDDPRPPGRRRLAAVSAGGGNQAGSIIPGSGSEARHPDAGITLKDGLQSGSPVAECQSRPGREGSGEEEQLLAAGPDNGVAVEDEAVGRGSVVEIRPRKGIPDDLNT